MCVRGSSDGKMNLTVSRTGSEEFALKHGIFAKDQDGAVWIALVSPAGRHECSRTPVNLLSNLTALLPACSQIFQRHP